MRRKKKAPVKAPGKAWKEVWNGEPPAPGDHGEARVEFMTLDEVVLAKENPKEHDIEELKVSIRRFGFIMPLLYNEGEGALVAGHGRHQALSEMREAGEPMPNGLREGWRVPVIRGLTFKDEREAKAYLVADNRLVELGGWSSDSLMGILKDISSNTERALEGVGYKPEDLAAMVNGTSATEGDDGKKPIDVQVNHGALSTRFLVPPFSVLSAREGWWRARKQLWLSLGIKSEVGRGGLGDTAMATRYDFFNGGELLAGDSGSVFDPVLCELAYTWFCPPKGKVFDPFAGGSVRGVIAAKLGRRYHGVELREEQVRANYDNATGTQDDTVVVRVSAKAARLQFQGCSAEYIRETCKGRCCWVVEKGKKSTTVYAEEDQRPALEARGAHFNPDGTLKTLKDGTCHFQGDDGLCTAHLERTEDGDVVKPRSCFISPWLITKKNTLIVRNRYKMLGCYKAEPKLPAYKAFRSGLVMLFGEERTQQLEAHFDAGGGDIDCVLSREREQLVRHVLNVWHDAADDDEGNEPPERAPLLNEVEQKLVKWEQGDSSKVKVPKKPDADMVFSCPPYADLEKYSDDPADISNMPYPDFLVAYREIIRRAVARLKPNRFAVWVVGEVRDEDGNYRNLVGDTVSAFQDAGAEFYNEAILVTPAGTLPLRAGRQFAGGRKLGKTHQNVLVFVKGDGKKAAKACGEVVVHVPGDQPAGEPAKEEGDTQ